ncbi:MAG TPA: hypothetical protein VI756_06845, partial [Blastocatellia bacterium]
MAEEKNVRLILTFTENAFRALEEIVQRGRWNTIPDVVQIGLRLERLIQIQSEEGFTELFVRNPRTGAERLVLYKTLNRVQGRGGIRVLAAKVEE